MATTPSTLLELILSTPVSVSMLEVWPFELMSAVPTSLPVVVWPAVFVVEAVEELELLLELGLRGGAHAQQPHDVVEAIDSGEPRDIELWHDAPLCVLRDCGVCECEGPPDWADAVDWMPDAVAVADGGLQSLAALGGA